MEIVVQKNQVSVANPAVSELLAELSKELDSNSMQIIEKKYAAPRISDLTGPELVTEVAKCIMSIHVITGWNLPDDKDYVIELSKELRLKLIEDFPDLNFEEIRHAFRKSTGVKDWGKNMNLELISGVLSGYCNERLRISAEEEILRNKPVQRIYTDEEILNEQRGYIESFYQRCRRGIVPHGNVIPQYFLAILIKDGFMKEGSDDMAAFFAEKLNEGKENLYVQQPV
ncbi:MAG: hypothetical protein QM791_04255 [Ferruginibacter sp.]